MLKASSDVLKLVIPINLAFEGILKFIDNDVVFPGPNLADVEAETLPIVAPFLKGVTVSAPAFMYP